MAGPFVGSAVLVSGVFCLNNGKFVELVGVLIMPLIFYSVIIKTTSVSSVEGVNAVNKHAVLVCLVAATITIAVTLTVNALVRPKTNLGVDVSNRTMGTALGRAVASALLGVVPRGPLGSLTGKCVLRMVVFKLLVKVVLTGLESRIGLIGSFFRRKGRVVVRLASLIVGITPLNMFYLVTEAFTNLKFSNVLPVTGCIVYILVNLTVRTFVICPSLLVFFAELGPIGFFGEFKSMVLFTFSSSASGTAVPLGLRGLSRVNIRSRMSSFAVPLNTAVGVSKATVVRNYTIVFTTRTCNVSLNLATLVAMVFATMVTSVKATKIPSIKLVALAVMFGSVKLPIRTVNVVFKVSRLVSVFEATMGVAKSTVYAVVITFGGGSMSISICGNGGRTRALKVRFWAWVRPVKYVVLFLGGGWLVKGFVVGLGPLSLGDSGSPSG